MKKFLSIIKYVRHFVNSSPTAEQEANDIWEYMIQRSNTLHTLDIVKALEKRAELEMLLEEKRCAEICRAVNSKYSKFQPKIYNPDFDKPLSESNVEFEIIKAN